MICGTSNNPARVESDKDNMSLKAIERYAASLQERAEQLFAESHRHDQTAKDLHDEAKLLSTIARQAADELGKFQEVRSTKEGEDVGGSPEKDRY